MTKRSKLAASTAISPFAHLNPAVSQPRAEEPDDDRDPDAEDGGADPDKDKSKKGKKAKKAETPDDDDDEGDDETDAEDDRDDEKAAARRRERGRCAAIFRSEAAGRNPAAAAELAFGTDMTRSQAIRVLGRLAAATPTAPSQAAPEPARPGASLRQRMQTEQVAALGPNGGSAELTPGQRLVQRAGNRAHQGGN